MSIGEEIGFQEWVEEERLQNYAHVTAVEIIEYTIVSDVRDDEMEQPRRKEVQCRNEPVSQISDSSS